MTNDVKIAVAAGADKDGNYWFGVVLDNATRVEWTALAEANGMTLAAAMEAALMGVANGGDA